MKIALCCGGSSLRDFLPFDRTGFDKVIAVNDAGPLVPFDHWAAMDSRLPNFQAKFKDWKLVDWNFVYLTEGHPRRERPYVPRYTTVMTLKKIRQLWPEAEIHAFGLDMSGERLDGKVEKTDQRWIQEEGELRKLDLSGIVWRGKWRP